MLASLLRPKLRIWKREWFSGGRAGRRVYFAGSLSLAIAISLFAGGLTAFDRIRIGAASQVLYAGALLSLLFALLIAALFMLDLAAAARAFFSSDDLQLLLSSPLTPRHLFAARLLEVLCAPIWLIVSVVVPLGAAFTIANGGGWRLASGLILVVLPLFAIPALLAAALVHLFLALLPFTRIRRVLYAAALACLIGLYLMAGQSKPIILSLAPRNGSEDLLQLMRTIERTQHPWLPSYWAAEGAASILEGRYAEFGAHLLSLYAAAGGLLILVYLLFQRLHLRAFSNVCSGDPALRLPSRGAQTLLRRCLPFSTPPFRAVFSKEIKTFSRDVTRTFHLLLLIGIALFYLSGIDMLQHNLILPAAAQIWWKTILILLNVMMSIFVVTAVSARFVLSSVASEGRTFWIVAASPLAPLAFLKAKFASWFVPVALVAAVLNAAGAMAIDAEPAVIGATALAGAILAYGVVGLGVGLGAYFCTPQPDLSIRFSIGFSSAAFMFAVSVLGILNLVPAMVLVFLYTMHLFGNPLSPLEWGISLAANFVLMAYLCSSAAHWGMKAGAQVLGTAR